MSVGLFEMRVVNENGLMVIVEIVFKFEGGEVLMLTQVY